MMEVEGDGRLFMDWESGDGLCRRALPNLGGRQTRHGKHLKVNYTENQAGVGGFGDAVTRSLMIRRDLWLYDPAVFTSSL